MLVIYDSSVRRKREFKPIDANQVNLYVCGMTVYDYCHMGHGRTVVLFDVIYRFLKFLGYNVNYVRNITDIDDKIIARANERGCDINELTSEMIAIMEEDFTNLGNLTPDQQPRATDHIDGMIDMIQTLLDKGFAYQAESGDICYRVKKFERYGQLSNRDLNDMRAGERVAIDHDKEDALDFVLWKMAKENEPSWPAPWGAGRPGWHIECSVMANCCLDEKIDIHGGGRDLLFPHHENEVAQAEAATGKKFANYWIHGGFLTINDEKMSKSLGNFLTIRDALTRYPAESARYFLMTTHYRSPFNWSDRSIREAHLGLTRLYTALRDVEPEQESDDWGALKQNPFVQRFTAAMCDDFNTPEALAVLFDLAHEINRCRCCEDNSRDEEMVQLAILLKRLGGVLGILQQSPQAFIQAGSTTADTENTLTNEEIEQLMTERDAARAEKNWRRADEIRDQLIACGVVLEDSQGETRWRRS